MTHKVGDVLIYAIVIAITVLACAFIVDHYRLVQVRQLLMDKGTPIQMDEKR